VKDELTPMWRCVCNCAVNPNSRSVVIAAGIELSDAGSGRRNDTGRGLDEMDRAELVSHGRSVEVRCLCDRGRAGPFGAGVFRPLWVGEA
jgi:hypothetical protein